MIKTKYYIVKEENRTLVLADIPGSNNYEILIDANSDYEALKLIQSLNIRMVDIISEGSDWNAYLSIMGMYGQLLMQKNDRQTQEFIAYCGISGMGYDDIVGDIINKIYSHNDLKFIIDHTTDKPNRIEWNEQRRLFINVRYKIEPLHFIWDLLHEYGHYCTGERQKDFTVWKRETDAWDVAESEIKNYYPLLQEKIDDFHKRKKDCLKSYQ